MKRLALVALLLVKQLDLFREALPRVTRIAYGVLRADQVLE